MKKTICIDFDGVIHSYKSGWKGIDVISDLPVCGSIEYLIKLIQSEKFKVCIYSSRSKSIRGRRAMKKWLRKYFEKYVADDIKEAKDYVYSNAFADPWADEVIFAAKRFVRNIEFPTRKPPAWLTIDDRCICFDGKFPDMDVIDNFKPWYKK